MSKKEMNTELVNELIQLMDKAGIALGAELEKMELPLDEQEVTASNNTAEDIAARYWLMQFLDPLSRKELKSIIDGFLVQLLNEAQAKKLVRFLMTRFPQYYKKSPEEQARFEAKRPA